MKRIALITIHATTNYGGALQAYAMQKVLSRYGAVEILDYRNSYVDKTVQKIRFGLRLWDLLRILKDVYRYRNRTKLIDKFNLFFDENYNLTNRLVSDKDFSRLESNYDIFVSGSDQIWNPFIISEDDNVDTRYLLDFVSSKPKVSYGSSIGGYQYESSAENRRIFKELACLYRSVSVRESGTCDYVGDLIGKNVKSVLDPTLLLDKKEWEELFIDDKESLKGYIFVYALKKDRLLRDLVRTVKNDTNKKVVVVDQDPFLKFPYDIHYQSASPNKFLKLLSNADIVVTNSFHGAAFSVNFQKKLYMAMPPSSPNRALNFMEMIDLRSRVLSSVKEYYDLKNDHIDWAQVETNLVEARNRSFDYLKKSLDV